MILLELVEGPSERRGIGGLVSLGSGGIQVLVVYVLSELSRSCFVCFVLYIEIYTHPDTLLDMRILKWTINSRKYITSLPCISTLRIWTRNNSTACTTKALGLGRLDSVRLISFIFKYSAELVPFLFLSQP